MFRHALLSVLALVLAIRADAAAIPFAGFIDLQIGVQVAHLEGSGVAVTSAAGVAIPGSFASATGLLLPVLSSVAARVFPVVGLQITARNGDGAFAPTSGGGFEGTLPLAGVAKVCLFATCSIALANVSVPLSVIGAGGTATVRGAVNVTVVGAPWTTGTVTAMRAGGTTLSAMGFRRGPASRPSSYSLPGGSLQLVTPVFISTNVVGITPAFAVFGVRFVPEPATLGLFALGIGSIAALARSRRQGS